MSRPDRITILAALVTVTAILLRFVSLGLHPLTDFEASQALTAMQVAEGLKPAVGSSPAVVHLNAILFFVFGGSDLIARLWSALGGLALVLLALRWRDRLGRLAVLLLAFFLAIDPGMVAISRLNGSPALALSALLGAWTFWRDGKRAAAGASAALALLCGSAAWFGLTGVLLAWGLERLLFASPRLPGNARRSLDLGNLRLPLLAGGAVLLGLGTLFLLSPKGLVGIFTALTVFISGWWVPSDVSVRQLLLALPAYELMPLIFGITGLVRGILRREALTIRLGLWFLVAILLAIIYPARQVFDLVWALIPLWILAARELSQHFDLEDANRWELAAVTVLMVAILIFAWLDLAGIAGVNMVTSYGQLRVLLFFGALVMIGMILVLVGMGWSRRVARLGGVWGVGIALTIFTLGMSTGAGGLRQPVTDELWAPAPRIVDADLLLETAGELSLWSEGVTESLPVVINGVDSPAMLWLLHRWDVSEADVLSPLDSPAIVITAENVDLALASPYRGQDFIWKDVITWDQAHWTDWVNWFVHRTMPGTTESVILWVRTDLTIDSQDQETTP